VLLLLLPDTQQQPGPALGQQLVQKVTHVQSGAAPLVAQPEYCEALTVPSKSIPLEQHQRHNVKQKNMQPQ
jgi:hypothetical protein